MTDLKNIKNLEQEKIIKPENIKKEGTAAEQFLELPEKAREQVFAPEKEISPAETTEQKGGREVAGAAPIQPIKREDEERKKEIEIILAKNLEDIYVNMPVSKQQEFRIAGEKTAKEINGLLSGTKVKLKKIVDLIKKWLSLVPGINKFFLDQESKIKADELLRLKRERDK